MTLKNAFDPKMTRLKTLIYVCMIFLDKFRTLTKENYEPQSKNNLEKPFRKNTFFVEESNSFFIFNRLFQK